MEMKLIRAERKQAKIKLALQGPSGSGKTFSALLLAFGLCNDWSKVAVVDTENHSADLYAHLGHYNRHKSIKHINAIPCKLHTYRVYYFYHLYKKVTFNAKVW